jgi:hypothetical protein
VGDNITFAFAVTHHHKLIPRVNSTVIYINSLTAIRVLAGTKNSRPVGFYSRNSTKSTFKHKHNNPLHYHHGGAVCPSYGVGSMDPPDRTWVTSSEGFGRGGGVSVLIKYINF